MEERISRIVHAMISSIRVIPASSERRRFLSGKAIPSSYLLRLLDAQSSFTGNQRNRLLLRIFGVDLHDGEIGCARADGFHHHAKQRAAAIHAGGIGLA